MRLGCNILPLPLVLAVVGVGSCAESFGPLGVASRAAGRNARLARRTGVSTSFRSATVKLGVGLLGLGSATLYLCSTLSSGVQQSTETTAAAVRDNSRTPTRLDSWSASNEASYRYQGEARDQQQRMMLDHTTDNYNGVTIESAGLPRGNEEFKEALETSLEAWKLTGKKGVWLKIPVDRTELVPVSLELGFELHHAEKEYVMLNIWLPATESQLPPNASHQVGIGALVLNSDGEVLVVREKHGPLRGTGIWKFPTGLIDAGEDLPDAAAREVLEETGLQTEFDSVLAFRHGHRGLFGKSDLFFVVRMRLMRGVDATALQPQESEIEECQWMPRHVFAKQSADSGTVLLKELSTVMEAHLAAEEAGSGHARADDGEGLGERGEEADRNADGSRRHAAAFTAKTLQSSRKYGGTSMLYHGKL